MSFAALADRLRTSLDGYTSSTKTGEDLQFSREKQAVNNAIRAALVAVSYTHLTLPTILLV